MTDQEQRDLLLDIAHRLTLIATGETPAELPINFPPGTIPVKPTGVLGQGKVRYWPAPIMVRKMDGTMGIELNRDYALRMTYLNGPDGEPYVPRIFRDQIGWWFTGGGYPPEQSHLYPVAVDKWVHGEDWLTQAEIDSRRASDAAWDADYRAKYGV